MSKIDFGKKVLEIEKRETIKILMVSRLRKNFSICEHNFFIFVLKWINVGAAEEFEISEIEEESEAAGVFGGEGGSARASREPKQKV